MDIETVREYCLSLPHATEDIQWGNDLLFRIGGKIFAGMSLDTAATVRLSCKCTPEVFAELIERENISPAPYVARYHWVALQSYDALEAEELKELIKNSYEMVWAKLPRKIRAKL